MRKVKASRKSAVTRPEVPVTIHFPADLEEWAVRTAFDPSWGLSDYLRTLLEGERYKDGRVITPRNTMRHTAAFTEVRSEKPNEEGRSD